MMDGGESERVVEKQKSSPDSSSVGYVSRSESMKRSKSCNDNTVEMNRPFEQLKSRSLSHLDKLEPQITTPGNISADYHQFGRFKSDNSDTSNASIASASGSIGYGGSRVPANSICYQSSTEGPSPGDTAVSPQGKEPAGLLVATTSGSALIGLSDSDGGCINPAYDNGDGNCPTGTNDGIVVDAGEGPGAATCGESTTSSTSNENSNQTCCLSSPSFPKSKSLSTTASLKKKSSSFLHRERKKPVLTRSQVSSSEYFSVCFEAGDNNGFRDEILIPATKGICLADSLHSSLTQRSLSFSQICVTDNGFSNSQELGVPYMGPLDAYTDISSLAGRTLIISDKDSIARRTGGHITLQKAASVGYRSTSNRLFTSTSTDETYDQSPKASSGSFNKQSKQKWTISFGSKGPQKSKLCELLDSYNKGIPKLTSSASNFDKPEYLEALEGLKNLPQSWTDIVNYNGMSETETKIQSAIWELVTTEVYYILALQTVTDLFLACLEDIQSHNILTDVDQNKLFSNIRDICESNLKFWTSYLHPMVKDSVETKEPMSVYKFKDGFMEFASIFMPYTKYCAEQSTCQYYCKELYQNNSLFMSYCAWCESQKMCNRLRLADILVRPMQRLTKYGLLLAAIKKHIADENEGEAIDEMIHSVEEFVAGVNAHLTTRQENERLKGINARIDSYEVVDSNNENLDKMVRQYSTMFDLCLPMQGTIEGRKLFLEGDLKFKDSLGKIDVHCFLLTDFLLVCKKNKHENLKVVRQPYMTDRLVVQIKEQTLYCCYLNDLSMVVAAFSLQGSKAQNWYDSITKAKHIYTRLKQGIAADVRQYGNIINITNATSNMNINNDSLSIRKSPLNSSIGSRVSSLNNSHSGSVDLNESKPVSIDFEKANSLSSDEGGTSGLSLQSKMGSIGPRKVKSTVTTVQSSSNSLTVQPFSGLGQSMPNLNLNSIQNSIVYSNTLSVPGTSASHSHSGMVLLSPSQRGISYPPPSPTRATLRRGFAFSSSIKNPPLIKTRNVASQQSFILTQQPSFNSATLGQHQQCLQTSPSPGSSPNVAFVKRKNSFHSTSQGVHTDPSTPSGEAT
nr:pleckstrin homology domain-containing family G member 5 isoform X4 [Aedes albopictus]